MPDTLATDLKGSRRPMAGGLTIAIASLLAFITVTAAGAAPDLPAEYGKVTRHQIADGVYLFTTTGYGDVGFCGNVVAIVTGDGVVVFDSGGLPATAAAILREIRVLTRRPVRYLVNSHWHWDHWGGNQVFKEAFPQLQLVTHEKTREQMLTVEPRWNDEGLKLQLPAYLASLQRQLDQAREKGAPASEIEQRAALLRADRDFLDQKLSLRKTVPDTTFSDAMTLRVGGREIQILHGRGITAGDTFVFLPKERLLVAGDLVCDPYPFTAGGTYPADWLETIGRMAALAPSVIVPGHGAARRDPSLLAGTQALFREVIRQVAEARRAGLTLAQTQERLRGNAATLAGMVGVRDATGVAAFPAYFLDTFVARASEEMDHPLGDLPDGIRAARDEVP